MRCLRRRWKIIEVLSRFFSRFCQLESTMVVTDEKPFLSGVVEGFYGRPWTCRQRLELFVRMQKWGMNTYVYAPKDDVKHRSAWRSPYTAEEEGKLKLLIQSAEECNVKFVYAISPGLDIVFSNPADVAALKRKMKQVMKLGCKAFALLFDDIDAKLKGADATAYTSSARAQALLTNELHAYLKRPKFLFCPTEYCKTRAIPTVQSSEYLDTIGSVLQPTIDILWTGNKVIPNTISTDSIAELSAVLRRKPIIWDNIHANDYDQRRIFLGPYDGRPVELYPMLSGVVSNPNCEFEANYIPLHSLATWCKVASLCERLSPSELIHLPSSPPASGFEDFNDVPMAEDCIDCESDCSMNVELTPLSVCDVNEFVSPYDPKHALRLAIEDWCLEFGADKQAERRSYAKRNVTSSTTVDGQVVCVAEGFGLDCEDNKFVTGVTPLKPSCMSVADISILVDLFYLPYKSGVFAKRILDDFIWLKENHKTSGFSLLLEPKDKVSEWIERVVLFQLACEQVYSVFEKFSQIPNEAILYDIYPYLWDVKEAVLAMDTYVQWLCGIDATLLSDVVEHPQSIRKPSTLLEIAEDDFIEAWHNLYLGGLSVSIHRNMPFNGGYLYLHEAPDVPNSHTVKIRPFHPTDKKQLYDLCHRCDGDSSIYPPNQDFFGDKHIGAYLSTCSSTVFVVEDQSGICGVAAAAPDNKQFHKLVSSNWSSELRSKYCNTDDVKCSLLDYSDWFPLRTSHMVMALDERIRTPDIVKRTLSSVLSVLKSMGSSAVYMEVDRYGINVDLMCGLGFYRMDIPDKSIIGRCL